MAEDRTAKEVTEVVPINGGDVNVTLRLKATKPIEHGGKWSTTLTSYLSRKDNRRPIPNQPLFVHRNGVDAGGANPKTKSQGQFSCDVELPGPGEYVLTVGIFETDLWAGVTVIVPTGPAVKSLEELALDKLRLTVTVTEETRKLQARLDKLQAGDEEDGAVELKALDLLKRGDQVLIPLRRQKTDGSVSPGSICCTDWHSDRKGRPFELKLFRFEMSADHEYVQVARPMLGDSRKVEFFLPEDRMKKVVVDIPAKPITRTTRLSAVTPQQTPFELGKAAAHALFGTDPVPNVRD